MSINLTRIVLSEEPLISKSLVISRTQSGPVCSEKVVILLNSKELPDVTVVLGTPSIAAGLLGFSTFFCGSTPVMNF